MRGGVGKQVLAAQAGQSIKLRRGRRPTGRADGEKVIAYVEPVPLPRNKSVYHLLARWFRVSARWECYSNAGAAVLYVCRRGAPRIAAVVRRGIADTVG